MTNLMRSFFSQLVFFITVYLLLPIVVFSADYKVDYLVDYQLKDQISSVNSEVNFKIKITNFRSDVYVNKFSIGFPKSFKIDNLSVIDDVGVVQPIVTQDDLNTQVEMTFNNPNTGRNSVNTFNLRFNQSNLFDINGNVWEVILPVIENKDNTNYQVVVTLPNNHKKISIAKPKPDQISNNQIVWNNPKTRTIYAVFGDNQIYDLSVNYNLKNTSLAPVIYEIAIPPDTTFQKIYLESLSEKPISFYQDEDGNYLANYLLKPKETKIITLKQKIQIFTQPREEVMSVLKQKIKDQKNYLLTEQKYWQIKNIDQMKFGSSVNDIYDYVINTLDYSYKRVNSPTVTRIGADKILTNPQAAICMEYTDLFIALSREKGIMSREVQGYGFSHDQQIRPLSLSSDILHSWPEYYDDSSGIWRPIDPTWEDTSGIDYFHSFDLNHITFVIHGKKADYPYPAGTYKLEKSKDIVIKPDNQLPSEKKELFFKKIHWPKTIYDQSPSNLEVEIKNNSNIYYWNIPVEIKAKNLKINRKKITIESLAPGEKNSIKFSLVNDSQKMISGDLIEIKVDDQTVIKQEIKIVPKMYDVLVKIGAGLLIFFGLLLVKKTLFK